jgi:predicted ATPase/class 3 adenylate cyclase
MSGKGQLDTPIPAILRAGTRDKASSTQGRGERRLLTALCYDLVGSTDLLAHSDVEDFHELILAFQQAARQAVTSRGGSVMGLGDGGLVLFPLEIDARDAASLAIHAGLEIVDACTRVGREKGRADLHVRVGIATSMALIRGSQENPTPENVTAIALAMATRLQGMAEPDAVIVSQQTRSLARRSHAFRFQGVRQVKGFAEPERIWRALSHRLGVGRFYAFGRLNIPLVGRAAELRKIAECWRDAVAGKGGVILIEGEAGIGKSRLLHEIRRMTRFERNKMLLFQCSPGGARSTLQPLLQSFPGIEGGRAGRLSAAAVADLFGRHGVHDADVVDVFSFLLGAEDVNDQTLRDAAPEVIQERTGQAVRRGLERVCAAGPVVVAVEDIHWIDPTSQYLLIELAHSIHRHPALLVLTTRPEAAGELPQLPHVTHIPLGRLDPAETRTAIAAMWPQGEASETTELLDLMGRITGGVPLFIEEICQWTAENAGFTTDQLAKAVSPGGTSILESVLGARLESLGPAREVARAAAVAGPRFTLALLREILPELEAAIIVDALDRLSEAGLLVRARSSGAAFHAFRHALIQETIYNASLRKTRQALHGRLYAALERNREIAPWIGTAALADHAERAGLIEDAIARFVTAGKESSARSAMAEARHLLAHALDLCGRIDDPGRRDPLKLSALAALGPVLTSTEGSGSPGARKLYEEGVEIARRRPASERAAWFPIYWGWWFTGTDLDNQRARAILHELKDVEDAEVQLQIRHCIWAIDFYLGRHESCIAAVDFGMALYDAGGGENSTLFGGHDAKVCGLAHRGLSEWLTGRATSAIRSVSEARRWAHQTGHIGNIAHACYNEAMLHCYRRDFAALRSIIAEIRPLTEQYSLRQLAAAIEIFEGWCDGNAGHFERGQDMIRQGLATHAELQTPEDYPVYCGMLAELMARTGETVAGLELLSAAAAAAERSGYRYWLAELHHRRARLLYEQGAAPAAVADALVESLDTALQQNAVPLLLGAYDTLVFLGLGPEIASRYRDRVELARSTLEPGEALIVNPEATPWRPPAARSV